MKTKKKVLLTVLSVAMLLCLLGASALAVTANEAAIDTQGYETLALAVANAQDGDVITLLKDVTLGERLAFNTAGQITIDGGGHRITAGTGFAGNGISAVLSVGGATLTLKDVTVDANGSGRVLYANAGKLVLDGATITGGKVNNNFIAGVYVTGGASFEMQGGAISGNTITGTYSNDNYLQYSADLWIGANATGTMAAINGGTVGSIFVNANAFSATNPGAFTLAGGTVTNLYAEYDKGYGGAFTYTAGTIENLYLSTTISGTANKVTPVLGTVYRGGAVAQCGTTTYATLAAAIAAADTSNATITLLANCAESVTVPAGKQIILALNGKTLTNGSNHTITNNGVLTIQDAATGGTVVNTTAGKSAVVNNGTFTLVNGILTRTGSDHYVLATGPSAVTTLKGGTILATNSSASLVQNNGTMTIDGGSYRNGRIVIKNDDGGVSQLTINNGTFTSTMGDQAVQNWNLAEINGGTFNGTVATWSYTGQAGKTTINGGTITGNLESNYYNSLSAYPAGAQDISTTIVTGGNIQGLLLKGSTSDGNDTASTSASDLQAKILISGGYFYADPAYFVVAGKAAVAGSYAVSGQTYRYTVREIAAAGGDAIAVVPTTPTVDVDTTGKNSNVAGAMQNAADAIEASSSASGAGLTNAGAAAAENVTVTAAEGAAALVAAGVANATVDNVTLFVQPYLEIQVTDATLDQSGNVTELALEITPMVQTVASTAETAGQITTGGSGKNAVVLGTEQVTVDDPVTITIQLPANFSTENLKIKHTKNDGTVYYYDASVTTDLTGAKFATFTVTHGFSLFRLLSDSRSATVAYENGETLAYTASNVRDQLPTMSKAGYVFSGWTFPGIGGTYRTLTDALLTALSAAAATPIRATAHWVPTGTETELCLLTFATNGGTAMNSVSAPIGATISLANYTPSRSGYVFAGWYADSALTNKVTSVKLERDTTVYAKWTTANPGNPFVDVNTGDYYYNAVLWAVEAEVTSGVTATSFAPNATCTRAAAVTFLWRAMGSPEPAVTSNPFADVSASAYYYKAVLWAVEQGITKGTSATAFNPNATVTRGEAVTFLWRAKSSPVTDAVNPFADVSANAYYAQAVRWAVEQGITEGVSATSFAPKATLTRGQIVTFLYRMLGD